MRGGHGDWISRGMGALLVASVAMLACSDDGGTGPNGDEEEQVSGYVTQVSVAGGPTGVLRNGTPPSPGSGPSVNPQSAASVVIGGSIGLNLSAISAFQRIIVGITGEPGYYDITLGSATTAVTLVVTVSQAVAIEDFGLRVAVANASGTFGSYATTNVTPIEVGTGDVQVSLFWDTEADVDLHVVDPSGEEIYYGNTDAASGGRLDHDSNALCTAGDANENVTWPSGTAPSGQYIVRVDYWSSCDAEVTHYVVTVNGAGATPLTFTGQFTGDGNFGGLGDGVEITRFNR